MTTNDRFKFRILVEDRKAIEVVGNIHENRELLK